MTKGQRIKNRRSELGFSQVELANKVGVSKQTLYKYETDIITNIPSDNIERLSAALSVSPAWIMGFEDPAACTSFKLSLEEEAIMAAYRKAPELTKDAVANVLGVKRENSGSGSVKNNVG